MQQLVSIGTVFSLLNDRAISVHQLETVIEVRHRHLPLHRFSVLKVRDRAVDHQLQIVIQTERPSLLDLSLTMNDRCRQSPCQRNRRRSLVVTSL